MCIMMVMDLIFYPENALDISGCLLLYVFVNYMIFLTTFINNIFLRIHRCSAIDSSFTGPSSTLELGQEN